jgi:protein-tyrosine phosphatase
MRAILPDLLWIGTAVDACNIKAVLDLGILAVVDLAVEEKPVLYPREIIYCRVPLVDGGDNPAPTMRLAIETASALIRARVPTLVCCGGGMSRSPAVTAAALAKVRGSALESTLEDIARSGPHDVAPAFWASIEAAVNG